MCGLCGVYGLIGLEEKKAFASLQLFSQLRGRDSTGLAVIPFSVTSDVRLVRELGGVESLVLEYPSIFNQDNWQIKSTVAGLCLIGHHRHCTSGIVSTTNAHPFDLDNIVGCHNGTLPTYSISHLPSYDKDLIDSQVILKEIDSGRTLEEIIENVKGAWALVWWNKKEQTLNMCRNSERTLHVAMTSKGSTLFWASEAWMLDVALRRAGFSRESFKILETTADKHLVWGRNSKFLVELQTSIDAKAKDEYDWDAWADRQDKEDAKVIYINKNKKEHKVKTYKYPKSARAQAKHQEEFTEVYVRTFEGKYIKKREYEYLTKNGCSWCAVKDNVTWDQRESVCWYADDHPVCEVCHRVTEEAAAREAH